MPIVQVRMLAFHDSTPNNVIISEVAVPDAEGYQLWADLCISAKLEQAFKWGQNDFQPQSSRCSVSVGDVVELDDKLWLCCSSGFKEIAQEDFDTLLATPRRDRFEVVWGLEGRELAK